jgi:hypothetical protein
MVFRLCAVLVALTLAGAARAGGPAPFDLAGPTLNVVVTRGETILPASEVPNLAEGDKLWIKTEFPATQSADYLMIVVFLRGSTNPPPDDWIQSCKTWTGTCARDGLTVTVPKGALQAVVFLAPSTAGDLSAVTSAVKGRPGAFVRASQDLNQSALDRSRLETYLDGVHRLSEGAPAKLREVAPLLARSLAIKVDEKCLDKIPEMQAACLTQGQDSLILNDGQSVSIAQTLTTGPAADLALAASSTSQLGYGAYSPYVASVLDIVRILDSFSTAMYQYIPALVSHKGDKLALTLNAVPSFYNPKSVLVVALPAIQKAQLPPLHAVDPTEIYCASRTDLVLPVEGAPLAFSTRYAHDITLTLSGKNGQTLRLPARPDGAQGGYVVNTARLQAASLGDTVRATLQGYWGFEPYQGPSFQLRNARTNTWALAPDDADGLIAGRQDSIHLHTDSVSCLDTIMLKDPNGKELKAEWKTVKPGVVEVQLPLENAKPGTMNLLVNQFGSSEPQTVPIRVFDKPGKLESFTLYAGDNQGLLKGSRLDTVASLSLGNLVFLPGALTSQGGNDQLIMTAQDEQAAAALTPNSTISAVATLKDGRKLPVSGTIGEARPRVTLIGKSIAASHSSNDSNLVLGDQDQLPQDAKLTFSVRAQSPAVFTRDLSIEVATADDSFSTALTIANGGLRLGDTKVAVATLDPLKAFGTSAFGPLKFRPVMGYVAGDWQPLLTLVRLPVLSSLQCPADEKLACQLSGADLFLIDAVAADAQFSQVVQVPDGFPGNSVFVPHPVDGRLYVRLRDNPAVVNPVALKVQLLPPEASDAGSPPASSAASVAASP